MVTPHDFTRRSFIHRTLSAAGAEFAELAGAAVAVGFGRSPEEEEEQARSLALADLSPLPRIGFKGGEVISWLVGQGVQIGAANNIASRQKDGALAARLTDTEALVLCDIHVGSGLVARLDEDWSFETAGLCFPVPRRDASFWFALTGREAAAMLAKLCGVDLRPKRFADGSVAQTSVARMSAIVIRNDLGGTLAFYVLGDSAAADYLWGSLIDAMAEFQGRPVGLPALESLARR